MGEDDFSDFDPFDTLSNRLDSIDQFVFNPLSISDISTDYEYCLKSSGVDVRKIKEFGIELLKYFGDELFDPEGFEKAFNIKHAIACSITPKINSDVIKGLLVSSFYIEILKEDSIEDDVRDTALTSILYYTNWINSINQNVFSKNGNDRRHEQNRKMKNDVFLWADLNMHKYKSKAEASRVLHKMFEVELRTLRDWLTEWGRKSVAAR